MLPQLSPTEATLYGILAQRAGDIVTYREIEKRFCCIKGRNNLVVYVGKLRRKLYRSGHRIETHNRIGYRLKLRKKRVPILLHSEETRQYAADVEHVIRAIMNEHVEVGFESQVAILGVAIGAILHQLPPRDREFYIRILNRNIEEAPSYIKTPRTQ